MDGKIHVILLAAGNSTRFGGNKLLYLLGDKPVYRYLPETLEQVKGVDGVRCIVSQYEEILRDMQKLGYTCVKNDKPEEGISRSIRLGIEYLELSGALKAEDAILFGVCDQPYVTAETLEQFAEAYRRSGKGLGCLAKDGALGNPAIFSVSYAEELKTLQGDQGGKKVMRRNLDDVCTWEAADALELKDIDRREDMAEREPSGKPERTEQLLTLWMPEFKSGSGCQVHWHKKKGLLSVTGLGEKTHAVVSVVGAGGKTTFVYALARELKALGKRVLVSTTTHMRRPEEQCFLWEEAQRSSHTLQMQALRAKLDESEVWTAGAAAEDGKIKSPPEEVLSVLAKEECFLILEADGSKGLPVKAPAAHEPVILPETEFVIGVTGFGAAGQMIEETAHRPELVAKLLGKQMDERLTVADLFRVMTSEQGLRKNAACPFLPVLNRCPKGWRPSEEENIAPGILLCEEME